MRMEVIKLTAAGRLDPITLAGAATGSCPLHKGSFLLYSCPFGVLWNRYVVVGYSHAGGFQSGLSNISSRIDSTELRRRVTTAGAPDNGDCSLTPPPVSPSLRASCVTLHPSLSRQKPHPAALVRAAAASRAILNGFFCF